MDICAVTVSGLWTSVKKPSSMRRMRKIMRGLAVASTVCAVVFAGNAGATPAPATRPVDNPRVVDALARSVGHQSNRRHATALPTWTGSFTSGGTRYPYTMVGTDPALGSATTRIPVRIAPLRLVFSNGIALDGTDMVNEVEHSPVFKDADFRSGHTQYGDAMQRASFWNYVGTRSPNYHVLLDQPHILPTTTLDVPAAGGHAFMTSNGPAGEVNTAFLLTLLPRLDDFYQPGSLLILLVKDVAGDSFLGFHFSYTPPGRTEPLTFIWSGEFTPGVTTSIERSDAYVLSHEVTEWINDPYVDNAVPAWRDPASNTCFNNLLETGDPVEFFATPSFTERTNGRIYHVTDAAGISWFAHDAPSWELGGAYSYNGTLRSPNALC
jgi:hypothetical protein